MALKVSHQQWIRWWFISLGAWTVVAAISFTEMYLGPLAKERQIGWSHDLFLEILRWWSYVPLTPVVYWLGVRYKVQRPHVALNLSVHVFAGIVFSLLYVYCMVFYAMYHPLAAASYRSSIPFVLKYFKLLNNNFHFFVLIYTAIVGLAHAIEYYRTLQTQEKQMVALQLRSSQLESQLLQAQLHALKSQLQPHFLFNTLNAISILTSENPSQANRMVLRLSELLRLTLENAEHEEITLKKEIDLLNAYLEIQKIRFGDRLTVSIDASQDALNSRVPSLILQPLVENSIQHGISGHRFGGKIVVRAHREDGELIIQVQDDGSGYSREKHDQRKSGGIGLTNTRQRLECLYGEASSLRIEHNGKKGTIATITVPYRTDDKEPIGEGGKELE